MPSLGSVRAGWVDHGYGIGGLVTRRITDGSGRTWEVACCHCDRFGERSFRLGLRLRYASRPCGSCGTGGGAFVGVA